jgi:hypothetical protein
MANINYFNKEEVKNDYCRLVLDNPRHSCLLKGFYYIFKLIIFYNHDNYPVWYMCEVTRLVLFVGFFFKLIIFYNHDICWFQVILYCVPSILIYCVLVSFFHCMIHDYVCIDSNFFCIWFFFFCLLQIISFIRVTIY